MDFNEAFQRAGQNLTAANYYRTPLADRAHPQPVERWPHVQRKTRLAVAGDAARAELIVYEPLSDLASLDDEAELVAVSDRQSAAGPGVCLVAVEMTGVTPEPERYATELKTAMRIVEPQAGQKVGIFGRNFGALVAVETVDKLAGDGETKRPKGMPDVLGIIDPFRGARAPGVRAFLGHHFWPGLRQIPSYTRFGQLVQATGVPLLKREPLDPASAPSRQGRIFFRGISVARMVSQFNELIGDELLPPTVLGLTGPLPRARRYVPHARLGRSDRIHIVQANRASRTDPRAHGAFLMQMLDLLEANGAPDAAT